MSARSCARVGLFVHRDQVQRLVPLLERGEGARFQDHALVIDVVRQAADLRVRAMLPAHLSACDPSDRSWPAAWRPAPWRCRPAAWSPDSRAASPPGPADRPPPAGRPCAGSFRRHRGRSGVRSMIVIEQRQRLHRRHLVGVALEEQIRRRRAHVVLRLRAPDRHWGNSGSRRASVLRPSRQRCSLEIKRGQLAQGFQFQRVAAPAEAQLFQRFDGLVLR